MKKIKIIGIMDEDPFNPLTWSGSSYYFFSALEKTGALEKSISAQLNTGKDIYYKIKNFHPIIATWRFKYRISTSRYAAMTCKIRNDLQSIDNSVYSHILQVGAWYDATNIDGKITVSYHDGNIASFMNNPYYKKAPYYLKYAKKSFDFEKGIYSRMHTIFPMSNWLADSFIKDFGVHSKKIFPVGAGVNLPKHAIEEFHENDYVEPSILFVGKDFIRKGGDYLLRAFTLVRKEIPRATLTIIGPSIDINDGAIKVLGPISKMNEDGLRRIIMAYKKASVFVLPSLYEPFGIALCEAMAFRLPCIGTNVCAIPEIIENGVTGFIVPPQNERSLADALIKLLKNRSLCKSMGDEGFKRYKKYYTWEAVTNNVLDVMSSLY